MKISEKNGKLVVTGFDAGEAYRIAERLEQDGILFYGKLAEQVKAPEVKETLEFLAAAETEHLNFFQDCLVRLREAGRDDSEDDDMAQSLDAGIFTSYQDAANLAGILTDIKKALKLGILVEDKSIKFYRLCRENISESRVMAALQNIIEEEQRHKQLLESLLKQ